MTSIYIISFVFLMLVKKWRYVRSNDGRKLPRVEQVEQWRWKYCSRQRYSVGVCWLVFLNLTPGRTAFANSAYPENWALFYKALSMLAIKKNGCFQGNCTSLSTLNKNFRSTFNFVPKINESLPKTLPFHTTL